MAIAPARWRSDRNEYHFGAADRRFQVSDECETPLLHVCCNEFGQTGLVNWHFAVVEGSDFPLVTVNANDMMSKIGKVCPRHQPDIAGARARGRRRARR